VAGKVEALAQQSLADTDDQIKGPREHTPQEELARGFVRVFVLRKWWRVGGLSIRWHLPSLDLEQELRQNLLYRWVK
jgi:hypothetical protein